MFFSFFGRAEHGAGTIGVQPEVSAGFYIVGNAANSYSYSCSAELGAHLVGNPICGFLVGTFI
jgi:hypothetical protein